MSCPQEPSSNDVAFKCYGRGTGANRTCIYTFWVPRDQVYATKTRCETCELIEAVIIELRSLVVREPYLLTEGMAGAPKKEAWELEGLKKTVDGDMDEGNEAFGDGMTRKERRTFRKKMEESFVASCGSTLVGTSGSEGEGEGEEGGEESLRGNTPCGEEGLSGKDKA